ncbi:MAG TPA: tetratricopeptide repeat protein [Casimicrobiaceae bacterium]|nr:tetratricopeptide repeat protein [Casimicrobiaceae bacterium]
MRAIARAIELQRKGKLDEAEQVYASLLANDDRDPTVLINAGVLAIARNDVPAAIDRLERGAQIAPSNAVAHANLGFALIRAGRDADALVALNRAIELIPDFAQAHNNRGIALVRLKHRDEAIVAFERALAALPAYADAAINLGELQNRAGDTSRAREYFARVRPGDPSEPVARVGLAFADAIEGNLGRSLAALEAIVAQHPHVVPAWHTLGAVRNWARQHEDAERAFRQALALDPAHRDARFGVASTLLARGRYREGFAMFEASREGYLPSAPGLRTLPRWDGKPLAGTLVVHGEQGLGDVVQFARFVPLLRPRAQRIVLLLDGYWHSLAPLLGSLEGVDRIVTDAAELANERPVARVSMLSLPALADAEVATLPSSTYLESPVDRRPRWREQVAQSGLRVGLAWSVYARDDHGYVTMHKSLPAAALAPILDTAGVSFYSLQPRAAGKTASLAERSRTVQDTSSEIADFGDTSALIDSLDLVISADTAVAHVAGALGKPVWLLDRFNGCWRWRLDPERSPWYPTLRIFRQARFGDWNEPVARVAAALVQLKR